LQNTFQLLPKSKVLHDKIYVLASCLLILQCVIDILGYVKINRSITYVQQDPIMDGMLFERVQNCRYFGTFIDLKKMYMYIYK
jgi:hypothetical protein